jgi:hypothetical protein
MATLLLGRSFFMILNDNQHNDNQHNDNQHNDNHHNDNQHNDNQHNDTLSCGLNDNTLLLGRAFFMILNNTCTLPNNTNKLGVNWYHLVLQTT